MMIRALAVVFVLLSLIAPAHAGSGFDQVMKTRTIRCAYTSLPPFINVDPATHQVSGLLYDITNTIGARLGMKVDWVEDVGYGEIAEGLNTGRYDAWCGVLWQTPARAGAMSFSAPLYKNKVFPCVRGDTTAYDASTDPLNAAEITFGGYDGDVSLQTAKNLFPKAKQVAWPSSMSFAETLQSIVQKKVDAVATCDKIITDDFNKTHANALKIAAPDKPITIVQIALALPVGDVRFKNMIDTSIYDMIADGSLQKMIRQYLDAYIDNTIILPTP